MKTQRLTQRMLSLSASLFSFPCLFANSSGPYLRGRKQGIPNHRQEPHLTNNLTYAGLMEVD
jgi:hypothetical protein